MKIRQKLVLALKFFWTCVALKLVDDDDDDDDDELSHERISAALVFFRRSLGVVIGCFVILSVA